MEHNRSVPAATQSSPGKAAFLGKTQREIIYFSLFSTKVACFPGNTNKDFGKTCIIVWDIRVSVAWFCSVLKRYPKGHLVSLGILPTNPENEQEVVYGLVFC